MRETRCVRKYMYRKCSGACVHAGSVPAHVYMQEVFPAHVHVHAGSVPAHVYMQEVFPAHVHVHAGSVPTHVQVQEVFLLMHVCRKGCKLLLFRHVHVYVHKVLFRYSMRLSLDMHEIHYTCQMGSVLSSFMCSYYFSWGMYTVKTRVSW